MVQIQFLAQPIKFVILIWILQNESFLNLKTCYLNFQSRLICVEGSIRKLHPKVYDLNCDVMCVRVCVCAFVCVCLSFSLSYTHTHIRVCVCAKVTYKMLMKLSTGVSTQCREKKKHTKRNHGMKPIAPAHKSGTIAL